MIKARVHQWFPALLLALLCIVGPARGADFEGFDLPDEISVFDRSFEIRGCGIREVFWNDVYLLALYLPSDSPGGASIRDRGRSKAIRLEIVYDGTVPDDIPDDWKAHLREEISRDMYAVLKELYQNIQTGDVVVFSYEPDTGNTVRVNGERVALKDNDNLIDALLDLWVGPDAVSKNLRHLLMSGRC